MNKLYSELWSAKVAGYLLLLTALFSFVYAAAKPAHPAPVKFTQPDGSTISVYQRGDENSHKIFSLDGKEMAFDEAGFLREKSSISSISPLDEADAEETPRKKYIFAGAPFPSEGEHHALVILVQFKDRKFSMVNPRAFYDKMLNSESFTDYGATGSAREYFIENSNGAFRPIFDVYGPVTLTQELSYYGANDHWNNDMRPEQVCIQACEALDDTIDFAQYDLNDDGFIDNVYVFYAGFGEADSMIRNTIWPHSANITEFGLGESFIFDGKELDRYAMSNELDFSYGRPDGIGTFTHEFSHVLGLPDLYATSYSSAFTPGDYSLLDMGTYNNQGRTPPYYTVFERYSLGWADPIELSETGDYTLDPLDISGNGYILRTTQPDEFFIFENRQKRLWDYYIPGHGMLVWHIDFNQRVWNDNVVNNMAMHQYVDIIEADGILSSVTTAGDTFPGASNVTSLSFNTYPILRDWNGNPTAASFSNIEENANRQIQFHVDIDKKAFELGVGDIMASAGTSRTVVKVVGKSVTNISEETVEVYGISGITVAILAPGESSSSLPAGIYIAKTPTNQTRKFTL